MAETEDQQDSVAENEDQYEPQDRTLECQESEPQDQTLEPEQYEPQYQYLEPQTYEPQDQSLEPQTYEPQAQTLELHQFKPQEQTLEPQQYEVPDQTEYQEYQVQEQAHEEMQDQPLTNQKYQPQGHEQYQLQVQNYDQMEGETQEHNGGEVHDQLADQGGTSDVKSPLKSELEEEVAVRDEEKRWPGWPGETVFRMLVPEHKVGRIIGRKGDVINKIVEETRARIKILDRPPGTTERIVIISAKEEPESSLPPSMNGLLRVHMRIIDGLDNDSKISTRLLVPTYQAGNLIGKQGRIIQTIRETTSCSVRVLGVVDVPVFSLQDDRVVEIVGEPSNVHKSLKLIASYLRKFLVDHSIIPLFETQMRKPPMDHMPPPPPTPSMEKQPHAYGRETPMNLHVTPSMAALQISQKMQIPLSYTDAVIGTSGSNISFIRRVSEATVNIQETRGVPGEMTIEISGTSLQVQTAQKLLQIFMAEATEQG